MGLNATCLTKQKQAAAYALKWETRFVAPFDWDALFLWSFAGMTPAQRQQEQLYRR